MRVYPSLLVPALNPHVVHGEPQPASTAQRRVHEQTGRKAPIPHRGRGGAGGDDRGGGGGGDMRRSTRLHKCGNNARWEQTEDLLKGIDLQPCTSSGPRNRGGWRDGGSEDEH